MEAVAIKGRGISGGDSDGAVKSMTLRLPLRVSISDVMIVGSLRFPCE